MVLLVMGLVRSHFSLIWEIGGMYYTCNGKLCHGVLARESPKVFRAPLLYDVSMRLPHSTCRLACITSVVKENLRAVVFTVTRGIILRSIAT